MKRSLFILFAIFSATIATSQLIEVPGSIVAYSNPNTEIYLGSPSITILPDGTYVASHDHFGPGTKDTSSLTYVYRSSDRGNTWGKISEIENQFWSNLFMHQGNLYIFGMTCEYGHMVIRKSTDGGYSWTDPVNEKTGLLSLDREYHTAPMPMIIYKGRIYRAVEHRNPPESWGVNFESLVISADINADLLKAKSWTTSTRLHYGLEWHIGTAWLEGNVVITPDNELVNILRVHHPQSGGYAAKVRISKNGKEVLFDPERDFLHFPGGSKKFTIRFDEITNKYWTLTNYLKDVGYNPERTRNCLALVSSEDLYSWVVHEIIIYNPDVVYTGFQYADWQFEGQDIIALVRTAHDDGVTRPHNCHDANYITFHRIENFAGYSDHVISTYYNNE